MVGPPGAVGVPALAMGAFFMSLLIPIYKLVSKFTQIALLTGALTFDGMTLGCCFLFLFPLAYTKK